MEYQELYNRKRRGNPEYRAAEVKKNLARHRKYRTDLFALLGNKCATCGFTDARALQIDHIVGGGKEERRVHGGSDPMYIHHLKNPEGARKHLQILCANCNFQKLTTLRENTGMGRKYRARITPEIASVTYRQEYNRKRRADPEYRKAELIKNKTRILKYRTDLIMLLGGKCVRCAFSEVRALQLDHPHGGGTREIEENGNIAMYYRYLKHPEEAEKKLRVLCANCNWIERAENGDVNQFSRPRTVGL